MGVVLLLGKWSRHEEAGSGHKKNCFNSVATIDILITSLYMYSYIQSMLYSCSQLLVAKQTFGM